MHESIASSDLPSEMPDSIGSLTPELFRMAGQRTIFGMDIYLSLKHQFARILARAANIAQTRGHGPLFDIAPRTFVFPDDFEKWRAAAVAEPDTIWISKPGGGARGEGIFLVTDIDAVNPTRDLVLQEYIKNPHLLDGHKYTLRVFVAVTSVDPLRAWVFPDGLCKLTTQPFSADRASLGNLFIHLTNPGVLRGDKSADFTKQRITHTDYRERLRNEGQDDVRLFADIHALIAKSLLAVREAVLHCLHQRASRGFDADGNFMLLGYDILVDANLRPWIIEANAGPSLETEAGDTDSGRRERQLKEQVATDMLRLGGVLPIAPTQFEPLFPSVAMFDWLPCYEALREHDWADLKNVVIADAATQPNSRHTFFLAQSFRDAGDIDKAIDTYRLRVSMGGDAEEVYVSLYEIAKLLAKQEKDPVVVIKAFVAAHEFRPTRAEALCDLATYLRERGRLADAYPFARTASELVRPPDSYVDESVYVWRALDEYAIAAYWAGRSAEGIVANEQLLASELLPNWERERIQKNLEFCTTKATDNP